MKIEEEKLIVEQYLSGNKSVNDIVDENGISLPVLYGVLRKHNVRRRSDKKRLSEDDQLRIVDIYRNNSRCTSKIAKKFGISDTGVRNILRRHGVKPCYSNPKISDDQKDSVVRLYESGKNMKDTAKDCGIVSSTVFRILHERKVKMRPCLKRKKLSLEQRRVLAKDYEEGSIFEDLYKKYKVSNSVVKSCLDEFGVKHRTGWNGYDVKKWTDRLGREWKFKSTWELKYAQWLDEREYLWDYEPCKFGLRECGCYTPDFEVLTPDGIEYHEVKGWLDTKSMNRMLEFQRMYPDRRLKIIGPADMTDLGLVEWWYKNHHMEKKVVALKQKLSA